MREKKTLSLVEKKYMKAIIVILVLFSIGLIFYFIFSADYGDGLEKTMENAGVEEGKPAYKAPFSYGDNYPFTFLMGCVGFFLVLCCVYLYGKVVRKKSGGVRCPAHANTLSSSHISSATKR